jgi:serine/threonine-protein kinase
MTSAMSQERWDALANAFADALELPAPKRDAFIDARFGDDALRAELRAELRAMLAAHDDPHGLTVERRFVSEDRELGGGLPAGARIGPYRIVELAGRGGMGEVYRAERDDGEFNQTVAIKLLRPDARSADLVRRFRTERALLAKLSHPNIAAVIDGGTAPDGRPYLVLRFIEGEPVTAFALRIPLRERIRLLIKIANAVQVAHNHLIIHRDIKPSNILVGGDGEPVLFDFGIAKLLDGDPNHERTQTGRAVHTPSHAAPEQIRAEPVTTATDVYALGALLFELLTGARPFSGTGSSRELERAILETEAPLPSTVVTDRSARATFRGDLDRITAMALRKEPERRYASAAELAADLGRYLDARPVLAQPDRWSYRATKFARRNRVALAFTALAVAVLTVAAWREQSQARNIKGERDAALRERAAADEVLAFVTKLFDQSNPRVVPGGDTLRLPAFLSLAESQAALLAQDPQRQGRIYRLLGNVRASRGDYAKAESLLTVARDIASRELGATNVEVLRVERELGQVIREYRDVTTARPVLERVVRTLVETQGRSHPDLVTAYAELASVVAEPDSIHALLDSAVALRARLHSPDSVEFAGLLDERARERGVRGHFAEAAAFDEAALRLLETRFPRNHPAVLSVRGNLANWYGGLAQWERALPLAEANLEVVKTQTTPGERLALTYERVALLQANIAGRMRDAERNEREALRIFRATVAPGHNLITNAMRNLAIIVSYGREAEGIALLDSAVARDVATGHADAALYLIAQRVPSLVRLGRIDEAMRSAERGMQARRTLPSGSTYAADYSYWMGLASLAAGKSEDAVGHLTRAHESLLATYRNPHPRVAMVQCARGIALMRIGHSDEARTHMSRGCAGLEKWGLADPTIVRWAK